MIVRSVEVVPWEPGRWGVSVRYDDGSGEMYPVGAREAAETEAKALRDSASPETKKPRLVTGAS